MKHTARFMTSVSASAMLAMSVAAGAMAQDSNAGEKPDDEFTMEEVIVTGTRVSLERARDIERAADVWKNVVAADDIGNFPDQNVAESLQRLPGLSISRDEGEGRFVIVRGLSPAFNNVTVNGVRMGSTGEETRDNIVSLDTVPSDLLNGIEVSKALTPDMDGDAIAGTIDLKTLSAFDRKKDTFSLRGEASYNARAEKASPKFSGAITKLFDTAAGEKTLGVALTASYFKRDIRLDDLRVQREDGDLVAYDRGDGEFYVPQEIDQRLEIGTRTRLGMTGSVEFRPNDDHKVYLNVTASKLDDEDIRVQQEWETRRASGSEVKVVGPNTAVLDDVDLEKQTFFKDTTSKNFSVSLGGENRFDDFELSYQGDYSRSTYSNPFGTRGQFRERDELIKFVADDSGVIIDATPDTDEYSRSKSGVDIHDPSKFTFDNILIDDTRAKDEIYTGRLDGKWNFVAGDKEGYLKAGVKYRMRDKYHDKEQLDMDPHDFGFDVTMADIGYFDPENTNLNNFVMIPDLDASKELFFQARDLMLAEGFNTSLPSDDFQIDEDVLSGYLMGQIDLSPKWAVIGGVRAEQTKLKSFGTIVETLLSCTEGDCGELTSTQLSSGSLSIDEKYTDWLPSLHFKYTPTDDLIFRLALTKAIKRPAFNENYPNVGIITEEQDDGTYVRSYGGGNPDLKTLKADQVDFLISWYPNDDLALSGGIFYKRIKNFVVESTLLGDAVAQFGLPIGDGTIDGGFDAVNTYLNGDTAKVIGVELNYYQALKFLPGIFLTGNFTYADSKSHIENVRPGETFRLPDQPKTVGNFAVGYENEKVTLQLAGNYVGEKLETVASDAALDEIRKARFSLDFGAKYNINDGIQVYFDAINLNNAKDERVFRNGANAPRLFESIQDYGRTFQLGLRANF
ncbi:TonB-dependent receptor [Pseudokordiimonas caeni]|uniref:TonB-dependent receptor n=1 Tax=Pseudokordiimonas caeni TaxID=2997908 RepID=UPI00281147BF|nr:TonB-dependent receptor [Pseudokordiimonas caeni]